MATYGPAAVAAGADDYRHQVATPVWDSNQTFQTQGVGSVSDRIWHSCMRFTGVTIPDGATIDTAVIDLEATSGVTAGGSSLDTRVFAVDSPNPTAATTASSCVTRDNLLTTAFAQWDFSVQTVSGTDMQTSDFANVMQELSDNGHLDSGGVAIIIQIMDDGNPNNVQQAWASFDHATLDAPTLTVTYHLDDTATPATIAVVTSVKTPTLSYGNVVSPSAHGVTTSVKVPTITIGETVTPTLFDVPVSVLVAVVSGSAIITPTPIGVTTAFPAAIALESQTVTPSIIVVTTTVFAPTVEGGSPLDLVLNVESPEVIGFSVESAEAVVFEVEIGD